MTHSLWSSKIEDRLDKIKIQLAKRP